MSEVKTYYLIVSHNDGTVTSYTDVPETLPEAEHEATITDIYLTSRQIVDDFERDMIASKVIQGLVQVLAPAQPATPQDKVRDALKKRGFDPESVTPVE